MTCIRVSDGVDHYSVSNERQYNSVTPSVSLLDLPKDIVDKIIYYLTQGVIDLSSKKYNNQVSKLPEFTLELNHLIPNYSSLLALSSTCIALRIYLGKVVFRSLSLIRKNQTDAIFALPKSFENFSIKDQYYRELIREVLFRNFHDCSVSDLAKTGFKIINGDTNFKSRYQRQFSLVNYVEYLECDRALMTSNYLSIFPNIKQLKLLDEIFELSEIDLSIPSTIEMVSMNIGQLKNPPLASMLPQLTRLDLFIDFNELHDDLLTTIIENFNKPLRLTVLNLFLTETSSIKYQCIENILRYVSTNETLKELSLRLTRRKFQTYEASDWDTIKNTNFLEPLIYSNIERFSIDTVFLKYLALDDRNIQAYSTPSTQNNHLTLLQSSLAVTLFQGVEKAKLLKIIPSLQVNHISFKYNGKFYEPHLIALQAMLDLIKTLADPLGINYRDIKSVNIEQCWSADEESVIRNGLQDLIYPLTPNEDQEDLGSNNARKLKQKLDCSKPWDRSVFNSPRFRMPVTFRVSYKNQIELKVDDRNLESSFWSQESSLIELEQYSRKQKALSNIWKQ